MPLSLHSRCAVTGLDAGVYRRAPKIPAAHCLPVALALRNARPPIMQPHEQAALDRVVRGARRVQEVVDQRSRLAGPRVRPRLDALASAWSCCSEVLGAYARLDSPFGERARVLRSILFARGLAFLTASSAAVWSEANRRYNRLLSESSREELVDVVGEEPVRWLETTTRDFAEVIGCGEQPLVASDPRLLTNSVREVQLAIVAYARVMAGSVVDHDPDSIERFRRAMAPLDELRASSAERAARTAARARAPADATPESSAR